MNNRILIIGIVSILFCLTIIGCNKSDDNTENETSDVESFIGSYDFTVTAITSQLNFQSPQQAFCDSTVTTGTHIITINTEDSLSANQLVIRNLIKNNSRKVIIDITDDAFVISDSDDDFSGSGIKTGNSIEIEYLYDDGGCSDDSGSGTAVKR